MMLQTPKWIKFLDETFSGKTEIIEYVQKVIGYCLTAEVLPMRWAHFSLS